ncbi:MAG: EAL domain-containing protein [Gammaproteobacteria bacterium]|nr:EAL domain-containing protein [Gammaproteobacteria bacterium]
MAYGRQCLHGQSYLPGVCRWRGRGAEASRRSTRRPGAGSDRESPDEGSAGRPGRPHPPRTKHIGLSIDDFGTGHSSLVQLRDIPFSELKVDRGFVHGASRSASLRVILEASLDMACRLGLRTVAEGVEDREDWDLLRTMDCDLAQGYFIARPMPALDVPIWIESWAHGGRDTVIAGI